jgi:hypothetical protein
LSHNFPSLELCSDFCACLKVLDEGQTHGSPVVVVVAAAATLWPFLSPICRNASSIILFGL